MKLSVIFLALASTAGAQMVTQTTISAVALLNQAQEAYNQRADMTKGREAIGLWESALKAESENYESLWKLARAYYWLGNRLPEKEQLNIFTKGKEYAEKAVKTKPGGVEGHYWLGVCLGRYGETKGILKSLMLVKPIRDEMETVLKFDPRHAGAYHVLGVLHRKAPGKPLSIGNRKKALHYAKKAVELDPGSIKYALGLGEAYEALGEDEKAVEAFEEVKKMPPNPEYLPESLEDKETAEKLIARLNKK
ncbi:MAG: tetratricopeptide repeat protein [Elusimicrobia bacterium]|nr:tetratricopeptide repeat protein [Elusimicrobiota bacterium]